MTSEGRGLPCGCTGSCPHSEYPTSGRGQSPCEHDVSYGNGDGTRTCILAGCGQEFAPLEVSCLFPETLPNGGDTYGYRLCPCGRYSQESQGLCACGRRNDGLPDVTAPARLSSDD